MRPLQNTRVSFSRIFRQVPDRVVRVGHGITGALDQGFEDQLERHRILLQPADLEDAETVPLAMKNGDPARMKDYA